MEDATELVMDIADLCLVLVDHAITTFDHGAKKVRGDSGAAVSSAIAGASTAIFIANLNLRSFQGGQWAQDMQVRVNDVQAAVMAKQARAFELASSLQRLAVPDNQLGLFAELPDTTAG